MGRRVDELLWEVWRRVARYERWSGTVAAVCLRKGVSPVSFDQGQRKLEDASGERQRERDFWQADAEAAEPVTIEFPIGARVRVPVAASRSLDAVLAAAARCEVASERSEARAC